MGALLLALGWPHEPDLGVHLERMVARSPGRGAATRFEADGISLGVQSLGWDASLATGRVAVVAFHGFVGNWRELRASHGIAEGPGSSDAERIAAAFEELGGGIIPLLRGEFAVVIHDRRSGSTIVARDAVGCRPLYMRRLGGRCLIATEIRQLVAASGDAAEPNLRWFANHLVFEPPVENETAVAGVECVVPGELCSVSRAASGLRVDRKAYWSLEDAAVEHVQDERAWLEELEHRISRSVRRWLPAHPAALTLSGGLDSSALWTEVVRLRGQGIAAAGCVRPLSVTFPGYPCDERVDVETTLERSNDRALFVDGTNETATSLRPLLLERLDTVPFATSYIVHLSAEAAAKDGRRTLITGHLGDHLFDIRAPGRRQRAARAFRVVLQTVLGGRLAPGVYLHLRRMIGRTGSDGLRVLRSAWRAEVTRRRWVRGLAAGSPAATVSQRLTSERVGWSLQSWEQICSGVGVEPRHPYCDPDVIAWAASVPRSMCDSTLIKRPLREVYRQRLPGEIVDRRHKVAFNSLSLRDVPRLAEKTPPGTWYLVANGVVEPAVLDSLLDEANNGVEARKTVLWIEAVESCAQRLARSGDAEPVGSI